MRRTISNRYSDAQRSERNKQVSFIDNKGCIFWDCSNEPTFRIVAEHPTFGKDNNLLFRVCFEHVARVKKVCERDG